MFSSTMFTMAGAHNTPQLRGPRLLPLKARCSVPTTQTAAASYHDITLHVTNATTAIHTTAIGSRAYLAAPTRQF
jgi:hypothetical protein